jgi:antitoxin (DNA-binding transcriptional repressor) of toxin-antitoxin stability system
MAISKFKATCLSVLERVRRTGSPIGITRFGKQVAEVHPPSPPPRPADWIGSMEGTGRIRADIVSPACDDQDWEALRS